MARRGENIYKRKDGRYEGRYIKRRELDGKAVYGYVYAGSYAEIKEKLLRCRAASRDCARDGEIRLSVWLKEWLDSICPAKETTKYVYSGHIENHIDPAIGGLKLSALSRGILQDFVNSLALSPSTVRVVFCVLKGALNSAEERGYIADIWSKVKLPKRKKAETDILTLSQQKRLEAAAGGSEDIGVLICLYTGLRIGEVCALAWDDVDMDNRIIRVCGTQARGREGVTFQTPKSVSSNRSIPIPEVLFERLEAVSEKSGFVVAHDGKPYDVRSYRRRFKRLLERAGLPDIRFHALRHTFSSRALEVGMDYKTLSEILGHSSAAITLDIYAHALDEHKKEEMSKLNLLFSPSKIAVS